MAKFTLPKNSRIKGKGRTHKAAPEAKRIVPFNRNRSPSSMAASPVPADREAQTPYRSSGRAGQPAWARMRSASAGTRGPRPLRVSP